MECDDGCHTVVAAEPDPLFVVMLIYQKHTALQDVKRSSSECLRDYEARFESHLGKFNALGSSIAISESMEAVLMMRNARLDKAQEISILAATTWTNDTLSPCLAFVVRRRDYTDARSRPSPSLPAVTSTLLSYDASTAANAAS